MAKEVFWHFLFLPCYLYDKKDDEESIDKDRLIDLVKKTSAADISEARVKKKVGLVMVAHIAHYRILSPHANASETPYAGYSHWLWVCCLLIHVPNHNTHTHTHTHQGKRDC